MPTMPKQKEKKPTTSELNQTREFCIVHPEVRLRKVCPACGGARTRGVTSAAKAKSSASNGRLGGRPFKWEATVVDAADKVSVIPVNGRTRKEAMAHAEQLLVADKAVITKLERWRRSKPAASHHSGQCRQRSTGRYTADCPGCLVQARAVGAAQKAAEILRAEKGTR